MLTPWELNKMARLLQTTFWNAFLSVKTLAFWICFHFNIFSIFQLTVSQHWTGQWVATLQAKSHYLYLFWPTSVTHYGIIKLQWVNLIPYLVLYDYVPNLSGIALRVRRPNEAYIELSILELVSWEYYYTHRSFASPVSRIFYRMAMDGCAILLPIHFVLCIDMLIWISMWCQSSSLVRSGHFVASMHLFINQKYSIYH